MAGLLGTGQDSRGSEKEGKMKVVRTRKNLGGGSGKTPYRSDLFSVTHWNLAKGKQTELSFDGGRARFAGHVKLASDKDCISVMTPAEISRWVSERDRASFRAGRNSIREEFREMMARE